MGRGGGAMLGEEGDRKEVHRALGLWNVLLGVMFISMVGVLSYDLGSKMDFSSGSSLWPFVQEGNDEVLLESVETSLVNQKTIDYEERSFQRDIIKERRKRKVEHKTKLVNAAREERESVKNTLKILGDMDAVKEYRSIDGMKDVPEDAAIKKDLSIRNFLLQPEDIVYYSERAADRRADGGDSLYFPKGIVWSAIVDRKLDKNGKASDDTDRLETFKRSMVEISKSAQSARMFMNPAVVDETALAVVVDHEIEHIEPEQLKLFDYVIYNRIPEAGSEYYPKGLGWGTKVSSMLFTPFEKTLFVDGDSRFCADMEEHFSALKAAPIAIARQYRSEQARQNSMRLEFNMGVIVYRRASVIATLFHDVLQSFLLRRRAEEIVWAEMLMDYSRFGNLRVHTLIPRLHFQPCRETKEGCVVSGDVVLLHGGCWLHDTLRSSLEDTKEHVAEFCGYLNSYKGSRFVATKCGDISVFQIEQNKLSAQFIPIQRPSEQDKPDKSQ